MQLGDAAPPCVGARLLGGTRPMHRLPDDAYSFAGCVRADREPTDRRLPCGRQELRSAIKIRKPPAPPTMVQVPCDTSTIARRALDIPVPMLLSSRPLLATSNVLLTG